MRLLFRLFTVVILVFGLSPALASDPHSSSINWQEMANDIFARAEKEKRLVLLNLEAVWCHWCHVMAATTYADKEVQDLMARSYLAVKVDQDLRPDLSSRYRDYGWPATIIFDSAGKELVKRAGYVEPAEMKALLKKLVLNPLPEAAAAPSAVESVSSSSQLEPALRSELLRRYEASFDAARGGLKLAQRYLDADTVEYALNRAAAGSEKDRRLVIQYMDENIKLIDPVWGGVYQYSTHYDWEHPHFEKIMATQEKNLRLYAMAGALLNDQRYMAAAKDVVRYVSAFLLSPDGPFFTSQDADVVKGKHSAYYFSLPDKERREAGIPEVDKHIYARENGWIIAALARYSMLSLDTEARNRAVAAAQWIIKNRSLPGGGFSHDRSENGAGPFLGDTLAMAEAFLELYAATGERDYLSKTLAAADFMALEFLDRKLTGLFTVSLKTSHVLAPVRRLDENLRVARLTNMLSHYTGKQEYKSLAELAMKFIVSKEVALSSISEPGVITAADEFSQAPLHITVVGAKSEEAAQKLFSAAGQYPSFYKRVEWWDKSEGPLPNPDVQYPQLPKAAAFICTEKRCSLPIFAPEGIKKTIELFAKH